MRKAGQMRCSMTDVLTLNSMMDGLFGAMRCEQLVAHHECPQFDLLLTGSVVLYPGALPEAPAEAHLSGPMFANGGEPRLLRRRNNRRRFFSGFTICHMQKSLICQRISSR